MKFVIFHGSFGSSDGNWFPDLKAKLEYMGQTVICPQYPIDNEDTISKDPKSSTVQTLDSWTKVFEETVLPDLKGKEKICFIGHSIGNVFILHLIEKFKIKLDCAIFVSPWLDQIPLDDWKYNKVNSSFYKTDFDFEKLIKYIPISYVLYSDTDPYIEPHRALHFAKVLESSHIMVRRAGHLNAEVNMNEFPLVYDLCLTRLDLSLYQKFTLRRQLQETVSKIRNPKEKIAYLNPEQLNDEGLFHFMHLSKGGFATFVSDSTDWDPESEYFQDGRKLALRGGDISRVFIIKNKKDLLRVVLEKQIGLDFKSGIKIYLINYSDLIEIKCEEDWGIWDNEYICLQHRNKKGEVTDGYIDSRIKSLLTAQNWRDRIIRAATKIEKLSDIKKFIKT